MTAPGDLTGDGKPHHVVGAPFTDVTRQGVTTQDEGVLGVFEHLDGGGGGSSAPASSAPASSAPAISADGGHVPSASDASDLIVGDTTGWATSSSGTQRGAARRGSPWSLGPGGQRRNLVALISDDGRYVAFVSEATNLVAGDTNAAPDVFEGDTTAATTARVSVPSSGGQANRRELGAGHLRRPPLRGLRFDTVASNLTAGDTNATSDAFVRDRSAAPTAGCRSTPPARRPPAPATGPSSPPAAASWPSPPTPPTGTVAVTRRRRQHPIARRWRPGPSPLKRVGHILSTLEPPGPPLTGVVKACSSGRPCPRGSWRSWWPT